MRKRGCQKSAPSQQKHQTWTSEDELILTSNSISKLNICMLPLIDKFYIVVNIVFHRNNPSTDSFPAVCQPRNITPCTPNSSYERTNRTATRTRDLVFYLALPVVECPPRQKNVILLQSSTKLTNTTLPRYWFGVLPPSSFIYCELSDYRKCMGIYIYRRLYLFLITEGECLQPWKAGFALFF